MQRSALRFVHGLGAGPRRLVVQPRQPAVLGCPICMASGLQSLRSLEVPLGCPPVSVAGQSMSLHVPLLLPLGGLLGSSYVIGGNSFAGTQALQALLELLGTHTGGLGAFGGAQSPRIAHPCMLPRSGATHHHEQTPMLRSADDPDVRDQISRRMIRCGLAAALACRVATTVKPDASYNRRGPCHRSAPGRRAAP